MGNEYVEAQYYCVGDMDYITADSVHQAVLDWFEGFDDSDGRFPIDSEVEVQGWLFMFQSFYRDCLSRW